MYTENYDDLSSYVERSYESNKINIDAILDSIDLETWDEDDFFDEEYEWDLNDEEI